MKSLFECVLLVPCACFALVACDRSQPADTEPEPDASTASEASAPAQPSVVLPETGQITTSVPDPLQGPPQLSPDQKRQVLNRMMNNLAAQQAQGLGTGTVTVTGAWEYSGYSFLEPNPKAVLPARLVAVDVTIKGHTTKFDIDDIEIVDGISGVSYGSDPHVTYLAGDAQPLGEEDVLPIAPDETRALLIYAFPEATPKFTLYYWGKQLTREPLALGESGWGLPYPEEAK